MKLPNGNPPPPQVSDSQPQTAKPSTAGQTSGATSAQPATSARAQLEQISLANRESTLARITEVINQQTSSTSRLLLDIRGQSLPVNAAIGETQLEAGDWVKVMRAGNELRLLGKLAPAAESTVARALAQRLPWQQSIDAGLAKILSTLATTTTATNQATGVTASQSPVTPLTNAAQPLPPAVRQAIEQLAALLPTRQALTNPSLTTGPALPNASSGTNTANAVKQWIEQSGLFAESRIARAPDNPPSDLKLALGRLVHQLLEQQGQSATSFNGLTPIPSSDLVQSPLQFPGTVLSPPPQLAAEPTSVGQMLRLLAGVLNRITVNQLHSQVLSTRTTADAPVPNNTLLLDLPWLNHNNEPRTVQVRIEEQAHDPETERKAASRMTEWRLSLAMNLDEAGPVHFDVSLGHGRVSAQVWAEQQSTLKQVREGLPELRKSFVDLGLEVVDLECRRGIPQGATTHLEHRLVDTKA